MQREYADWVEQRRLDAHAAVGIMRRAVEQRVERERQRMAEGVMDWSLSRPCMDWHPCWNPRVAVQVG